MRIVDAVKGPFSPSPLPFPTFLDPGDGSLDRSVQLHAPVSERDAGHFQEPDDPY